MKNLYLFSLTVILFIFSSCNTNKIDQKETEKMIIASKTQDCVGVSPMKCMLVKTSHSEKEWTLFYDNINGFNYKPGYNYEILVRKRNIKNPPADASSIEYDLIKIIKKQKE